MKIRAEFVSNSSSTSFLIITDQDLDRKSFFSLMGIQESSPLAELFSELHNAILHNGDRIDLAIIPHDALVQDWFGHFREKLTPKMIEKLEEGRRRGSKAYYGWLGSESTNAETFFCTDSFEAENDQVYLNALECIW